MNADPIGLPYVGAPAARTSPAPPDRALARRLGAYWAVLDPRSAALLTFTACASATVAGGLLTPARLAAITLALGLCALGARAVANYIDRDIDALMERTRSRPLPSGAIPPARALGLGIALLAIGLLGVAWFGALALVLTVLGLADNLVVYALLTKRSSPWSIVLGAPSGGAPAFVGYVAIAGRIDLTALFLLAFVLVWTPIHIWSLAIRSRDDYARAEVPMLPVTSGVCWSARCVGLASLVLAVLTLAFVIGSGTRLVAPIGALATVLGMILVVGSLRLVQAPTAERAWKCFKLTAPYLGGLFALLALNAAIMGGA